MAKEERDKTLRMTTKELYQLMLDKAMEGVPETINERRSAAPRHPKTNKASMLKQEFT